MGTFLNSFWNFVFCLKFHPQQFSPNENFKNSFFPPLFLPPLILKNFSPPPPRPPDLVEFKNPIPPLRKGGRSRYDITQLLILFIAF